MSAAFRAVKTENVSISAAAKSFGVPRMSLSDRVYHKVPLHKSKMGVKTALTDEEETALCNYITYMANRGFPLSAPQLLGFELCIAKERNKEGVFTKNGPSRKWLRGFKRRHPNLNLRCPDALDRGRACLGNVNTLRDYFELLKETMDANKRNDKPSQIYNCDEAALYLNKSAGQKVLVPTRTKHTHSLSVATNEHISVHCCVNAAGHAIPPMIIFSKSLPGGAYHSNGPINASYACSDSSLMDQTLYSQWFGKTFLSHAVQQRPLLMIQDGAPSHVSVELIRSAIENDVILLCLPPRPLT
ncbi:jerky protein homolog-like [Ruditapes philippinarum]|uniref:jerky protein homolog-like n=1 Tax=Ruditapes philippinarum TaxID=129788 RepID=UPI00295BEA38|nr:jerky protein homolog-like [Ruditapes philippinarum]